jgi:hypothetical protein
MARAFAGNKRTPAIRIDRNSDPQAVENGAKARRKKKEQNRRVQHVREGLTLLRQRRNRE